MNTNKRQYTAHDIQCMADRMAEIGVDLLPLLEFLLYSMDITELRKQLMEIYFEMVETILGAIDEKRPYPLHMRTPLYLLLELCNSLERMTESTPSVTIKAVKP